MSTYKVIQDVEAEDHILGPLSLRQFIYGLVAALFLYLSFLAITKHAAFLLILFLPPALFTGFFAFPFGKDQPTEVWALAKIRFLFKPRLRIWNQSGVKELVSITVPKKIEIQRTNGLSQTEVRSRLEALADTIDSRGWAIKNVVGQSSIFGADDDSERLINPVSLPQAVPEYDVPASEDILDERSNHIAQQFDQMITSSAQTHHQKLIDELNQPSGPAFQPATASVAPQWFSQPALGPSLPGQPLEANPTPALLPYTQASAPIDDIPPAIIPTAGEPTAAETAFAAEAHEQQIAGAQANAHLHILQPTPTSSYTPEPSSDPFSQTQLPQQPVAYDPLPTGSPQPDPAILNLATNNDLNVATLARQASIAKDSDAPQDEVVISLR